MATTTKELTIYQTPYLAFSQDSGMLELLRENLGDDTLSLSDLPRVTTPSGGAQFWTVEEQPYKELIGTVLDHHVHRTYWERKMGEGESTPPDCASTDGKTGRARRDEGDEPILWADTGGVHNCDGCPFAQWGSKGRNAIACGKRREIVFQVQDRPTPIIVDLGPTSAEVFRTFLAGITMRGIRLSSLEIGLSLERVQSGGKIDYSRVKVREVRQLEAVELAGRSQLAVAYSRAKSAEVAA